MAYERPCIPVKIPVDECVLQYAAGMIDTDGTFVCTRNGRSFNIQLSITQSEKGANVLTYMYEHFGGAVGKHRDPQKEGEQTSYIWRITKPSEVIQICEVIKPYMTVKRREAELVMTYPFDCGHVTPVIVENTVTNEKRQFSTVKEAFASLGKYPQSLAGNNVVEIYYDDVLYYQIYKLVSCEDQEKSMKKRNNIYEGLMTFHNTPHDPIPDDFVPSIPYIAGIVDGDGVLDTHGKSSQHHSVSQKHRPLLDMLQRVYGGSVCPNGKQNGWCWDIYVLAEDFLKSIAPYIVGKKKQVELILNMKGGEAQEIHRKLSELKGKNAKVTAPAKVYKTDVKELPRGVHQNESGSYFALLAVNKTYYTLTTCDTIEKALETYKKYKALAQQERITGKKVVNWEAFKKEAKLNRNRLPEPEKEVKERFIYPTPSRTYQVKIRRDKTTHSVGTYETLDEAIKARDEFLNTNDMELIGKKKRAKDRLPELDFSVKHKYIQPRPHLNKYSVRISRNNKSHSVGTFETLEEAIKARDDFLETELEPKKKRITSKDILPEPDPTIKHKYIHPTPTHKYNVKVTYPGHDKNIGTFETLNEALAARNEYLTKHNIEITDERYKKGRTQDHLPPPDLNVQHKYIHANKERHTYRLVVPVDHKQKQIGTYYTLEDAIEARDEYLESHNMTL